MADSLEERVVKLEQHNVGLKSLIKYMSALQFIMLDIMLARGILPDDSIQSQIEGIREELRDVLDQLSRGDSGA